jgi:two-component sensor histidine kinase/CHASE3 domain sensor protein
VPNTHPKGGKTKLRKNIWLDRISPLVLLIAWAGVTAIISVLFFKTIDESRIRVRDTHDALMAAKDFLAAATDAETGQRGYLITLTSTYLAPYHDGLAAAETQLRLLETMKGHNAQQLGRLSDLRRIWIEKANELASTIELAQKNEIERARAEVGRDHSKNLMDRLRKVVSEIESDETATRISAISEQAVLDERVFAFIQLTTLAAFAELLNLLYQARRAASKLENEVANRQSAEDLGRERAEQALRMRVMNRELVHRTKNLISVVQAIVRNQDAATVETEKYAAGLSSRLVSLAATMDILVRENWGEVALADLIAGQLGHFSEDVGRRITVTPGPAIKFTASESQMLGLALHELGTNAAKYGALAVPDGRIDISWTEDHGSQGNTIVLHWKEIGGLTPSPPIKKGFGSRITGPLVGRAVNGTTHIDYLPEGLNWTLTFPRDRHDPDRDGVDGNGTVASAGSTLPDLILDPTKKR